MYKLLPLLPLLLTACTITTPPQPVPVQTCEATRAQVAAASAGLWLISETDEPWAWQTFPHLAQLPAPEQAAQAFNLPAADVKMLAPAEYFARFKSPPYSAEEVQRYAELRRTFEATHSPAAVYLLRSGPRLRVVLVGVSACGVSGLAAWSVET